MTRAIPFLVLAYTATAADIVSDIARVESRMNHAAIGDGSRARGAWQIHKAAWDDACKRLGVSWDWSRYAHIPEYARVVAGDHLSWLQARFIKATGRAPTAADNYALWNLGYDGYLRRGFRPERTPTITRRGIARLSPRPPEASSSAKPDERRR